MTIDQPFQYRPNTWDFDIAKSLILHDEYQIQDLDLSNRKVCDIGLHCGFFSYMCHKLGASEILSFEPSKDNFNLAVHNLYEIAGLQNKVTILNAAVWSHTTKLNLYTNDTNTGAYRIHDKGEEVAAIGIDEVLDMMDEIYILKIDAEHSEKVIIPACTKFNKVTYLIGEYHCLTEAMICDLVKPYFDYCFAKDLVKDIGIFWAWRAGTQPPMNKSFMESLKNVQ